MILPNLNNWKAKVLKEKSIYHTMNKCNYDTGRKCLIAEGWAPAFAIDDIQAALKRANERSDAVVPSILNVIKAKEEAPTYFKTNKFTSSFQGIVDAYGIARYREVNPGTFLSRLLSLVHTHSHSHSHSITFSQDPTPSSLSHSCSV